MERYLANPRHVEIQVLADAHGNVVSLGSVTVRPNDVTRKLIEEAPAPGIDESVWPP